MTATTINMPQSEFIDRLKRAATFTMKASPLTPPLEIVQFRATENFLTFTATDWQKLGVFRADRVRTQDENPEFTFNIPGPAVKGWLRAFKPSAARRRPVQMVTLTFEGGMLTVADDDGLSFTTGEGEGFPDVRGMWKTADQVGPDMLGRVAPALLSEVMKAMASEKQGATFWQKHERAPIFFRSEIGFAIVMPVRMQGEFDSVAGLVDGWAEALSV